MFSGVLEGWAQLRNNDGVTFVGVRGGYIGLGRAVNGRRWRITASRQGWLVEFRGAGDTAHVSVDTHRTAADAAAAVNAGSRLVESSRINLMRHRATASPLTPLTRLRPTRPLR